MRLRNAVLLLTLILGGCSLFLANDQPDGSNCVPYARHVSGIKIYGDAHEWWQRAEGRYTKGKIPAPGAVLVLAKTNRLRHGHLAVVTRIRDGRVIAVDHANWWPGEISKNMPVMDVSPNNDWSQLRFWNEKANGFGQVYPALGFIYSGQAIATRPQDGQTICIYKDQHDG